MTKRGPKPKVKLPKPPGISHAEFSSRGGYGRAKSLTPERRLEIAHNAIATRYAKAAAKRAAANNPPESEAIA